MVFSTKFKDWHPLTAQLVSGLKYRNVKLDPTKVTKWVSPNSELLFKSAESTGQMEGLGQEDLSTLISKLRTGELVPDQLAGWSTKTILASLLLLMVLKARGR